MLIFSNQGNLDERRLKLLYSRMIKTNNSQDGNSDDTNQSQDVNSFLNIFLLLLYKS